MTVDFPLINQIQLGAGLYPSVRQIHRGRPLIFPQSPSNNSRRQFLQHFAVKFKLNWLKYLPVSRGFWGNFEHQVILVSEFKMLPLFYLFFSSSSSRNPSFAPPSFSLFLSFFLSFFFYSPTDTSKTCRLILFSLQLQPRSRILSTPSHLHVNPTIRQEIQMIKQRYFFQLQSDNPTNPIDLSRLEIDLKNEFPVLMSGRAIS